MNQDIIIRYCEGKCSEAERLKLETDMAASAVLADVVTNYKQLLALQDDICYIESIDVEKEYQNIQQRIRRGRFQLLISKFSKVAAILLLPLLAFSAFLIIDRQAFVNENQYTEIRSASGTVVKYLLPDESTIWLNSGTVVRYPISYGKKNRSVELLQGEIFLDVQHNKEKPFYVETSDGISVQVLGTRFNVSNYLMDSLIETSLEQGHVSVTSQLTDTTISILPNESVLYNKNTRRVEKINVNPDEKMAWINGKLVFRNTPLEDIFKRLSTHFNVDIKFVNHYNVKYRFRATFKGETLQQILEHLSESAPMKWDTIRFEGEKADDAPVRKEILVHIY